MTEKKILNDTSDWLNGEGIFSALDEFNVPWKEYFDGEDLDLDYYANRSCNKIISNLVNLLLGDDGKLDSTALTKLATIIYNKYGESWNRAFYAFSLEYNPIHNKNYEETYSDSETSSGTNNSTLTHNTTKQNTGTQTDSGSKTNTGTQTDSGSKTNTGTQTDSGSNVKSGSVSNIEDYGTLNQNNYTESDELDFGTGNNARKDETTKSGEVIRSTNYQDTDNYNKEDTLTFTNRKDTSEKTGEYKTQHSPSNYTTSTDSWGQRSTKNRINAFNGGLKVVGDSTTYDGGEDGSSGSGSGGALQGDALHKRVVESGSYTDTTTYGEGNTPFKDETAKTGTETHTIKETGKKSETEHFNNFKDSTAKSGKETHTINKTGSIEYLESYNDVTDTKSNTRTDNLTETTGNTRTDNLTETTGNTRTDNLSETLTGTDTTQGSESGSKSLRHDYKGEGNIGVVSTQSMLRWEIELRKKFSSLFDTLVFPDVDKVLTINLFGTEHL